MMRTRAFHPVTTVVIILLCANTAVHASPVIIRDVIQVLDNRNASEYRLQTTTQSAAQPPNASGSLAVESINASTASLLSGVTVNEETWAGVEGIELGDVDGTICDCGDILLPAVGFPKWPLLFLAAVPLLFIHDCDDCDSGTPAPVPTPTSESVPIPTPNSVPTPVPEPTSLFLFGSGLTAFAAGLRRRYVRAVPVNERGLIR